MLRWMRCTSDEPYTYQSQGSLSRRIGHTLNKQELKCQHSACIPYRDCCKMQQSLYGIF